ncbi:MAG: chromosomal replication initiator protein DnaA [Phycisphaeraceae bacterium]|nr:chromosomal replication initiator protein DnaA [Phycisphaeraceae bacterium]
MAISDPSLWRDMLAHLRRHHAAICRQWFDELEPLALENGLLRILAQNPIQQNYLQNRCIEPFNDAAQSASGALLAVRFELEADATDNPRVSAPASEPVDDGQIVLSPDYCFENFVTGPGNHLAQAAAVAVAEQPGRAYNPLFLHGGVGLGKTHLLQAICQTVLRSNAQARICYLSCDTFINHFMESVQSGHMKDFRNRYRHVDLLLIDDIHFLAKRERTQEEFFHTFNTLYQSSKQIVLSSDSPPDEIPQLEERLVSRFNWGLVARIDKPCYETRVAIIKTKAKVRDLKIPDEVICHIAERIDSNTRELEGAITKIQSMAALRNTPIDMPLARQALGEEPGAGDMTQLTIQNIIDAVTGFYGVKLADLQSKRRNRSITLPRQICMYLARKRTRYSLEEIGGYFGGRDHTTVMHALKTTEHRIGSEPEFAQQIEQLDSQLTNNISYAHA